MNDAVRRELVRRRDDPAEELQIKHLRDFKWSKGIPLPIKDHDFHTFEVRYQTGKVIVVPDRRENHWRIPYISRYDPGDMKALLDEFVRETGKSTIKFVNLSPDGTARTLSDAMGIPDARDLRECVHGFEECTEQWESAVGSGTETVDCLIGEWEIEQ